MNENAIAVNIKNEAENAIVVWVAALPCFEPHGNAATSSKKS